MISRIMIIKIPLIEKGVACKEGKKIMNDKIVIIIKLIPAIKAAFDKGIFFESIFFSLYYFLLIIRLFFKNLGNQKKYD